MGTTRMGTDPATSVVDANLRTHDVPNLYLVTTGCFVTGGVANPTLTLSALALRLGDHLAKIA
jgi:choline dehydrogenase-like flavoprotein